MSPALRDRVSAVWRSRAHVHSTKTPYAVAIFSLARARVVPRTFPLPSSETVGRELTFTHAHARGEDNCCGVIRHDGDEHRIHAYTSAVVAPSSPLTLGERRRCNNPYRHGWLPLLGLHNRALIDNLYGACRFI